MASDTKFTMKLMVNKATNKVIFAEASKEVVDFLISLLEMPIGSTSYLLKTDEASPGSFHKLFKSLEALDKTYFQSTRVKTAILKPVFQSFAAIYSHILLPAPVPEKKTYYGCYNLGCTSISDAHGVHCPTCTKAMTHSKSMVKSPDTTSPRGYVKSLVTYTIMDDLTVVPTSGFTSSNLVLKQCGISFVNDLEETVVDLGLDECLKLLKSSLQSTTVLSDVFLAPKSEADPKTENN